MHPASIFLLLACLSDSPTALGDSIATYARSQLGARVGDGECTSLAAEALRRGGARAPDPFAGIWGQEIKAFRDLRPGDILQFEDATFVKRRLQDGGILTVTSRFPHHTAIVSQIRKHGPRPILVILHQNVGSDGRDDDTKKLVQEGILELATQRGGTVRAYRPVAGKLDQTHATQEARPPAK